mmetsp:Transcript_329/g.300  ORF Transcript_329/g.300 Transcript_329/m.300 type:complete len:122 (-) Transcript_329:1423-1788(-)
MNMVILFMLLFKSLGDECETLHQLDSGTIVVQGLESGVPARGFGGAFEGRFELTRWSWMECAEGRLNGRYKDLSTVFLHSPKTGGSVVESALMAKKRCCCEFGEGCVSCAFVVLFGKRRCG